VSFLFFNRFQQVQLTGYYGKSCTLRLHKRYLTKRAPTNVLELIAALNNPVMRSMFGTTNHLPESKEFYIDCCQTSEEDPKDRSYSFVFVSKTIIELVKKTQLRIDADATFNNVPKMFKQLFIIQVNKFQHVSNKCQQDSAINVILLFSFFLFSAFPLCLFL
jgi:hypothetical protein